MGLLYHEKEIGTIRLLYCLIHNTLLNKILFCKPEKGYLTNSTGLALSKPKPVDSLNDDIWYDKFFSAKIKKIKNKTSLPVALYKARYLKFFL